MLEKLKKTAVVLILTLLIWTGAYLALERDITRTATLDILSSRPLLVTFINAERPVEITLKLKGPAAKITQLEKMLQSDDPDKKEKFEFYFDAEEDGKAEPGRQFIDVPKLLRKTAKIRNYNLTIESCKPSIIEIAVEKLVKKTLTIQCIDKETGAELVAKNITPSPTVEMYVRKSWTDADLKAKVVLTPEQIVNAKNDYITMKPFIVLADGEQPRYADYHNIILPSTILPTTSLQPSIGYICSENIWEKYDIKLLNEKELTTVMSFRATREAEEEYRKTTWHLVIPVTETEPGKVVTVPVIYNFPQQYVRNGEIELAEPDKVEKAKFKLVPKISQSGRPTE
jgi:hypothetical protein